MTNAELAKGYASRFLWVCVKSTPGRCGEFDLPEEVLRELQRKIAAVLSPVAGGDHRFVRTPAAAALWREWYPELSAAGPGMAGAACGRGPAQVMRLALVYAALAGRAQIDVDDLRAAREVWRYCVDSARCISARRLATGGRRNRSRAAPGAAGPGPHRDQRAVWPE